jgi:Uma2 family endonuclease
MHYTYADYLTWPEGYPAELIDGTVYVREPPAPSRHHQEVVGELYHQVRLALAGTPHRTYIAPFDVRLPKSGEADEQIDTVLQPDVIIACDRNKLDDRGMRGGPDWVAEVRSPGTGKYDQKVKVPVYERAGVREVWLIDPVERTVSIYRLEDSGRYGPPRVLELKGRTTLSVVPEVSIDWDRVVDRMD